MFNVCTWAFSGSDQLAFVVPSNVFSLAVPQLWCDGLMGPRAHWQPITLVCHEQPRIYGEHSTIVTSLINIKIHITWKHTVQCIQPNIQNVGGPFLHLISNIGERVPLLLSLYAALTGTWLCMMERSGHRGRAGNTRAPGRVSEWICDKDRDLSANGYLHKILVSRWNNKSPHICLNLLYNLKCWYLFGASTLISLRKIIINKINNKPGVEEIKYLMEARNKLSPANW